MFPVLVGQLLRLGLHPELIALLPVHGGKAICVVAEVLLQELLLLDALCGRERRIGPLGEGQSAELLSAAVHVGAAGQARAVISVPDNFGVGKVVTVVGEWIDLEIVKPELGRGFAS